MTWFSLFLPKKVFGLVFLPKTLIKIDSELCILYVLLSDAFHSLVRASSSGRATMWRIKARLAFFHKVASFEVAVILGFKTRRVKVRIIYIIPSQFSINFYCVNVESR